MDPRELSLQKLLSYCLETQAPDGWAEFVRRTQPLIAGVATKCVFRRGSRKPAPIDDLVQEIYKKLCASNFKALRDFDFQHDNAFFGFLKVVTANVVEDHFLKKMSRKEGGGQEEEDIEEVRVPVFVRPNSLQPAELAILMDQIDRCLNRLATEPNFKRDYSIFWLYYGQGLTAKAISQLPGIRLGTKGVESTLLRLTRYVKACLTASPPPPRKRVASG